MAQILALIIWIAAGLLVVASLLPLSKLPYGLTRGPEFLREQFFGIAVVLGILALFMLDGAGRYGALAMLVFVALMQLVYIVKFTPIWKPQSVAASPPLGRDTDRHISLLAANVKKSNRAYERLITLIRDTDPDIVMAIEVDEDWIAALDRALRDDYAHWIKAPMDNGYGLCVMSRLKVSDSELRELVTSGVPSIRTTVTLRDGNDLRLYVVHPEPPVINHDTKGRDSEIAMIGLETASEELPTIVTGDLNDVAWSTTTRRFQRLSGLLDPRVGRGFYNTFSALTIFMRWPLDHLFHDARFRFIEMTRLGKIGSDHFPMLFRLALAEDAAAATQPDPMDPSEKAEVKQMIRQEQSRPREPIGSDWEDED